MNKQALPTGMVSCCITSNIINNNIIMKVWAVNRKISAEHLLYSLANGQGGMQS